MALSERDAALRAEALYALGRACAYLEGGPFNEAAFRAVMYDHPGTALRRIAAAEAHLRRAKVALKVWRKRRGWR